MREALAKVGGLDPLHMQVGEDVVVTTLGLRKGTSSSGLAAAIQRLPIR